MKIIRKRIEITSRKEEFKIIPIGDVHLGARACDEELFEKVIKRVEQEENTYWLGMGDMCDFINRKDPRYTPHVHPDWLIGEVDLAKAQKERFLEITKPIAHKCLCLLEGNHETAILKHFERDIYSEIVTGMKDNGGFEPETQLAMGYYGWLILNFDRETKGENHNPTTRIVFNLHHGFVGGKLAGAKALNMQRWLWTHDADLVIFGHSHNTGMQIEAVEYLDSHGNFRIQQRRGAYGGTFLRSHIEESTTYSEVKGYFPLPMSGIEINVRPGAAHREDMIRVIA